MNHTVHLATACLVGFLCFFAGLVLMGVIRNERFIRKQTKLLAAITERDRLKAELSSLNRQYYELEDVIDVRNGEIGQLRADLLELRAERVVFHSDMPPEAA